MKLSRTQQQIAAILGPLDGEQTPGGCDKCDAYQTVEPVTAGVWTITVHHDEDCPELARHQRRAP
jgi:hypothetical protein